MTENEFIDNIRQTIEGLNKFVIVEECINELTEGCLSCDAIKVRMFLEDVIGIMGS